MNKPESKEKCCPDCIRAKEIVHGLDCFNCHCHQRPESAPNNHECKAGKTCEERPETICGYILHEEEGYGRYKIPPQPDKIIARCSNLKPCPHHQRPESEKYEYPKPLEDWQRPESDWKPALTKLLDNCLVGSAPLEMRLVDFIARQRDSEYQRGKDVGWAEHEQEWKNELKEEYQRGLADGARQERENRRGTIRCS